LCVADVFASIAHVFTAIANIFTPVSNVFSLISRQRRASLTNAHSCLPLAVLAQKHGSADRQGQTSSKNKRRVWFHTEITPFLMSNASRRQ
jgi:hypothetical protein